MFWYFTSKLNHLHIWLHVCMLSFNSIEQFLEKELNRTAVLFSGIAPAILEAQTWSHFGLGKKKETSPYHPCPSACLAKCIQILFCSQWIPQKIGLISANCVWFWTKGDWFLQRIQEGCVRKGGQWGGQGGCGVGGGMCVCWGAEIGSQENLGI